MPKRTYLDANAGIPLLPEVRDAVVAAFTLSANASSVHAEGRRARALIEEAREEVAASVGGNPENVVFTSGATEAVAAALTPHWDRRGSTITFSKLYVGATEHPCVLSGGRFAGEDMVRVPVDRSGVLDLAALERRLSGHDRSAGAPLVAVMLANNETGAIQPVREIARVVERHDGALFCDAVQGLGRVAVDIASLGAAAIAISAHKLGGPQGAGALILADSGLRPKPLWLGGGQERGQRAGTENVAAIVGFGVAARLAKHHLSDVRRVELLRNRLEKGVLSISPQSWIASAETDRLPNTTLVVVPGSRTETAVIALDLEGIAVSAGSACSSGKVASSHVLEAMGGRSDLARSGIRISLPPDVTEDDVEAFLSAWRVVHPRIVRSRAA